MKRTTFFNLLILGLVCTVGGMGCKKKPYGITDIPGRHVGSISNPRPDIGPGGTLGNQNTGSGPEITPEGIAQPDPSSLDGRNQNRSKFADDTVYFALDSATIKEDQKSKLEAVAAGFKAEPAGDLLVEGHCDERGTEGYNLSLGDKRANSLREYLVNLGVSSDKIHTISFGEAKPAVDGHDESAWSKNRRGEFIFVEPLK
ncbi:MAG: OmpA family protein [Verrucomicrobiota bacterium]